MKLQLQAVCAVLALAGLFANAAQAANVQTKAVDLGALSVPTNLSYGNSFSAASGLAAGDVFYDDYAFSVAAGGFSTVTASIDLGSVLSIQGLQARLYQGTLADISIVGSTPSGGLVQPWSDAGLIVAGGTGSVSVINGQSLAAGNYVLEIRGQATGSEGGFYAGGLSVASAVPEPAPALLLGAGVLFVLRQRRQRSAG